MPGLANVFFRDVFAHFNGGVCANVTAGATASGTIQTLSAAKGPIGKMMFRAIGSPTTAASSGVLTMYLMTGTVSSAMTSISATVTSIGAVANSVAVVCIDTRAEWFANMGTASSIGKVLYVQPIVTATTKDITVCVDVLGWCCGNDPASNVDAAAVSIAEYDAY